MNHFVLFDDVPRGEALMFRDRVCGDVLTPDVLHDLDALLARGWAEGLHAVVMADYEFGLPLQDLPAGHGRLFLHWFREKTRGVDAAAWLDAHADAAPAGISTPVQERTEGVHLQCMADIRQAIRRGDTYQINYTTRLHVQAYGDPARLYLRLRQPVAHAVLACLPDESGQNAWTLCFSPELFLEIGADGVLHAEPMKGTAPIMGDGRDDERARRLQADPKNRAENLMIVDLLRNDLGRIAETGGVSVPKRFTVSRFGSVWQMTSAVRARAKEGTDVAGIFRATFPCGSVTGAPKRSSMQIIGALEASPRGIYTGSIGHLEPCDGGLGFQGKLNVAIRTLSLSPSPVSPGTWDGVYGVGSGIVWDSDAHAELREWGWKSGFVNGLRPVVGLIETMRVEGGHCPMLPLHLGRLAGAARALNIPVDLRMVEAGVRHALAAMPDEPMRLKVLLNPDGSLSHDSAACPDLVGRQRVAVSAVRLPDHDFLRRFKTTRRAVQDQGWQEASRQGAFDSLFFNESGCLLEGGRSNVFVRIGDVWHTPPLALDVLGGVMRQRVLDEPRQHLGCDRVEESCLTRDDLERADGIMLSNALRGVFEVDLIRTR